MDAMERMACLVLLAYQEKLVYEGFLARQVFPERLGFLQWEEMDRRVKKVTLEETDSLDLKAIKVLMERQVLKALKAILDR